jgi:outer membrane protein
MVMGRNIEMKNLLLKSAAGLALLAAAVCGQTTPAERATKPPTVEQKQAIPPGTEPKDSLPEIKPSPESEVNNQLNDAEKVLRSAELQSTAPRELPPLPEIKRLGTNGTVLALSLNDVVKIGLENNNEIEIARDEVRFAETTLRALRGVYDPVFSVTPLFDYSVSPTANLLGGSRANPGRVRQADFLVNSSVRQMLARGGGSYSAFFNSLRRSNDSSLSALDPYNSAALGVSFTQPLWRNFRIDRVRRDIRVQSRRIEQADSDFRRKTIETVAEIQRAYWNLVFALREQKNRLNNIELVREQYRTVEGRIREGNSAPLERVQTEAELARQETELLRASREVTVAENKLKQLILPNSRVAEWSAEIMPTDQTQVDFAPVNLDETLKDARENRQELAQLKTEREINAIDRQYLRNQTKPRVDVVATFATTGLAGKTPAGAANTNRPLPDNYIGGYGQTLGNLFGLETRSVVVGVTIEIPFRNRAAREQLAGAEIRRQQLDSSVKSLELTVETEVRNAAQDLETARQTVLRSREARRASEVQLAGEQQLFRTGNSTTFLVFERTNQLINARTAELRAETDYNTALANLQRATGTTLKAMNISLNPNSRRRDASVSTTSGISRGNYILPPRETAKVSREP